MYHGAGAAGLPNRNRAALALIFGMHIVALLAWMQQRQPRLPSPAGPQVVSILLQPHAIRPRPPAVAAVAPTPSPLPAPAGPAAGAAAPGLDDARAPVDVRQAIREQGEAEGGFALGLSKRQAGRIDRELRKGKSGIPEEPDTPMGRFRRGLEAAHIDRSNAVFEDSYTSPDGTVTYRKRIGNASYCRRSGSVSPLGMRGMIMGNEAGDVPCPKGVTWKKD